LEDSWTWGPGANLCYHDVLTSNSPAAEILVALRDFMHESDMMSYLAMMTARLTEMHRVLKPTGSLYLHCDSTACHYFEIILDRVFGPRAFRNEIIWKRSHAHNDGKQGARHFGRITESILFYSKTSGGSAQARRRVVFAPALPLLGRAASQDAARNAADFAPHGASRP
jgi:hypothetical protein